MPPLTLVPVIPSSLSSARVLNEGVNIPIIDSVCFIDPRTSTIDIVQCCGRAFRLHERKNMAKIFVPTIIDDINNQIKILEKEITDEEKTYEEKTYEENTDEENTDKEKTDEENTDEKNTGEAKTDEDNTDEENTDGGNIFYFLEES